MLDTAPGAGVRIVGDQLPGRIRRAFDRYRFGPAVFKVDFAIEGDVTWTREDARRAGTLHLGGVGGDRGERGSDCARRDARPAIRPGRASTLPTRQIERFAPGFRERILATATRSTPEMETYNANYVGGDISAGANTAKQIALRPRTTLNPYKIGVKASPCARPRGRRVEACTECAASTQPRPRCDSSDARPLPQVKAVGWPTPKEQSSD